MSMCVLLYWLCHVIHLAKTWASMGMITRRLLPRLQKPDVWGKSFRTCILCLDPGPSTKEYRTLCPWAQGTETNTKVKDAGPNQVVPAGHTKAAQPGSSGSEQANDDRLACIATGRGWPWLYGWRACSNNSRPVLLYQLLGCEPLGQERGREGQDTKRRCHFPSKSSVPPKRGDACDRLLSCQGGLLLLWVHGSKRSEKGWEGRTACQLHMAI